jgi:hypothetical protein
MDGYSLSSGQEALKRAGYDTFEKFDNMEMRRNAGQDFLGWI